MKNIQVIDGAENCAYSVYQTDDNTFFQLFPGVGQDIEFVEDLIERSGKEEAAGLLSRLWDRRVEKDKVIGIHGTLFFELDFKKVFYPTKREADFDDVDAASRRTAANHGSNPRQSQR